MTIERRAEPADIWPAISIIIPVFNGAAYIADAIKSCVNQVGPSDEIVVVDDGSFDGTAEILRGFIMHPQIKILHQTNQGVSSARNFGVRSARGKFVSFLDADDELLEYALHRFRLAIASHPDIDVFFADYWISDIPGLRYSAHRRLGARRLLAPYIDTTSGEVASLTPEFSEAYAADRIPRVLVHTNSIIMKRSVFDRAGGFLPSLRVGEDLNFWARCFASARVAVLLGEPQSTYFRWRGSTEKYELVCQERVRRLRAASAGVSPFGAEWRRLRRRMAREYLNLIYWIGIDRAPRAVLARALWRSVTCYPILNASLRYFLLLLLPRPVVRRLYFLRASAFDSILSRVRMIKQRMRLSN
jgi:glycosyltransferase involved in cell wall biosynthesis